MKGQPSSKVNVTFTLTVWNSGRAVELAALLQKVCANTHAGTDAGRLLEIIHNSKLRDDITIRPAGQSA